MNTNTTIPAELREAFMNIIASGDEAKARVFLVEHLEEFPQNVQDDITMAFFEEALEKKAASGQMTADFQRDALKTLDAVGKTEETMKKNARLAEIKKSMQ